MPRSLKGKGLDLQPPKALGADARALWFKMTPKQRALAFELSHGGCSQIDAYRAAYEVDPARKDGGLRVDAHRAAHHPNVLLMTDWIREAKAMPELSSPEATRQFILKNLAELAVAADRDSVRVAALGLLGKARHVNLWTEVAEVTHRDGSVEDVKAALKDTLQRLLESDPRLMEPNAAPIASVSY